MRFVFFYHSLVSDWNHGHAHSLRGILEELLERGHEVRVFEPDGAWSREQLLKHEGRGPIRDFYRAHPRLGSAIYDPTWIDLDLVLDGADAVLVHEWNEPALVQRLGAHRLRNRGYRLLFHDTDSRAAADLRFAPSLEGYDGVLAASRRLAEVYASQGWAERARAWPEAADVRRFRPLPDRPREGDLVWIGSWGSGERAADLERFLFAPVAELGMAARAYGPGYPRDALARLSEAGVGYGGWLPGYRLPEVYARFGAALHLPRRPPSQRPPSQSPQRGRPAGAPAIQVFEALACGIPLVSAGWDDGEDLFTPGADLLVARSEREMTEHLRALSADPALARRLAEHGRRTVLERHTCARRVSELLALCREPAAAAARDAVARSRRAAAPRPRVPAAGGSLVGEALSA